MLDEYFLKAILNEKDLDKVDSSLTKSIVLMNKYCTPDLTMNMKNGECVLKYSVPYDLVKGKIATEEEAFNLRVHGWELSDDEENIILLL